MITFHYVHVLGTFSRNKTKFVKKGYFLRTGDKWLAWKGGASEIQFKFIERKFVIPYVSYKSLRIFYSSHLSFLGHEWALSTLLNPTSYEGWKLYTYEGILTNAWILIICFEFWKIMSANFTMQGFRRLQNTGVAKTL